MTYIFKYLRNESFFDKSVRTKLVSINFLEIIYSLLHYSNILSQYRSLIDS